jgi:hypothetical protein
MSLSCASSRDISSPNSSTYAFLNSSIISSSVAITYSMQHRPINLKTVVFAVYVNFPPLILHWFDHIYFHHSHDETQKVQIE